ATAGLVVLGGVRPVCPAVFFQAEDGIRDRNVTGVQTCALPIFVEPTTGVVDGLWCWFGAILVRCRHDASRSIPGVVGGSDRFQEIGRASCREEDVPRGGGRTVANVLQDVGIVRGGGARVRHRTR